MKNNNYTKVVAIIMMIVTITISFFRSIVLWVANTFFSIKTGQISSNEIKTLEMRKILLNINAATDDILISIVYYAFVAFAIIIVFSKMRFKIDVKFKYWLILSASIIVPPLLLGLIDNVFSITDYVVIPIIFVIKITILLIIECVLESLLNKFKKAPK